MPVPRTEKEIRGFLGSASTPGRPLLLYFSVSDMALGCRLAQLDDSGKERAIYYLSKRMLEYEMRYVTIKRLCLALVWATRRLRHYMTEFSMHLISRLDPLRYLFDRPTLTGRLIRWLDRPVDDDFPDEEFVAMTSLSGWCMYFDGATNQSGYEIGVSVVEYEACILGLETALELGIRQMEVLGDSNLLLRQIQGDWKTRDINLRPYHAYLELLVARFDDLRYVYLPRVQNGFSDALATLASSADIPIDVVIRPSLIELRSGTYPDIATAKDQRALRHLATRFVICGDTSYRRSADGSPKSSSGHEFILVAIDYFTKWVEAASYARLTSARVAGFIRSHIICRYGVPHELISDRGVHFRAETRFNQLNLLDEKRLRATDHIQAYQRKMARAFRKRVKPRPLQKGDLVLRILRGLIGDPRGKLRPSWSGPYVIRELTPEGLHG
ncbi:hypothetical protein CK203_044946 [Vitis vinifera]|uniref:Uncharacterized protein n=1 Tax=Vitis vinifera TaxID=29760 RepID=A0A438HFH0_VITVI|nr:hypothetical protein CK203_044946 [Vitis vinifera]